MKKIIILAMLIISALPSTAKINGGVSKDFFMDTSSTLMHEEDFDSKVLAGKYWEKNPLRFSKYRPLFLLSNKELYNLMPKEEISVVQRISAPAVYNISLKDSSITKIQLTPVKSNLVEQNVKSNTSKKIQIVATANSIDYAEIYRKAKKNEVESDEKIAAAKTLKNSNINTNFYRAIDLLNDITRNEPYNAYAFYLKGEVFSLQKNSSEAIKNYVAALKINPTSKPCYLGIAKELESSNKEMAQKYYAMAK